MSGASEGYYRNPQSRLMVSGPILEPEISRLEREFHFKI
jgi:hypothetical protein